MMQDELKWPEWESGSPWKNRYVESFNRKLRYQDLTTTSSYCRSAVFNSRWNLETLATRSEVNPWCSTKLRLRFTTCLL